MAVVIASALDKDMAGSPLFRGVSFKLERGDRMTLAGRNGAGKTTLLRMVSGETGIDGGELVFEKGTRVALHDQRPPRERELTLRDYVLSGCRDLVALEEDLRRARGRDGRAARRRRAARALLARAVAAGARRRLELAHPRARPAARPRLRRRPARPQALHLLGRRAHARLAGARARGRPRPAAARRAHEPPRHRLARVARGVPHRARRRGDPRGARPLVPRGGGHLRAGARGGAARASSPAPGTRGGARRRRATSSSASRSRSSRPRSRAWSASSSASATRRRRRARPSRA